MSTGRATNKAMEFISFFRRCFVRYLCVDSQKPEPVAREFQNLYFGTPGSSSIINAFIEERDDYPKFPTQLGCQGLLLLDCEGRIATMRSPAFLDFREKAFKDVEHLLEALIATGKAQQVATSSSESLVSSEHVNLEGRRTSIAFFFIECMFRRSGYIRRGME